jgi:hypothetical protein
MEMKTETHAWRVRLRLNNKQVDQLSPALFELDDIRETWPRMEIYFSFTSYAMFMVACARLPKPVDVTKFDVEIVDMRIEPERVYARHTQPRPIPKLRIQPKDEK